MADRFSDATGIAEYDFYEEARAAARRHNIPEDLFLKLVKQESGFNPNAVSEAGAQGLTQLMPGTADYLGVEDPFDPLQNLEGGARYLSEQLQEFGGDPALALAAYNAGPGRVRQYGGIPPFEETQNYVRAILGGTPVEYDESMRGMGREPLSYGQMGGSEAPPEERSRADMLEGMMTGLEMMQGDIEYCPAGMIYDSVTKSCVSPDNLMTSPRPQPRPERGAALQRFGLSSLV